MALYLTEEEEALILKAFKHNSWWVAKSIVGKISTEQEEKEKRSKCKHKAGEYIGHRTCCVKCDGLFKPGQGESWELITKKKK